MYNKTPTNPYTFCGPGFEVKLILMVVKDVGPTIFLLTRQKTKCMEV